MPLPVRPTRRQVHETLDDEVYSLGWDNIVDSQADVLLPALGSVMTAEGATDTLPFGAICTESSWQRKGDGQAVVNVTYKKPKRLDARTDLTEIKRMGPSISARAARLTGFRIFLAPDATAQAEIAAHLPPYRPWTHESTATVTGSYSEGTNKTTLVATEAAFFGLLIGRVVTITGVSGAFTITDVDSATQIKVTGDATCDADTFSIGGDPYLLSVQPHPAWRGGLTRIVTQWGQLSFWHRRELTPGQGVLEGGASMVGEKAGYDLDGEAVDAEWWDAAHHYRYVPVNGSAVIPTPKWNYRIRVVLTSAGLGECKALFGKQNDSACSAIGGAGAKTLWFNGFSFRQSEHGSSLYHAVIDLAYHADTWDKWLQVEKKEEKAVRFQVFDTAGADTGLKKTQTVWQSMDPRDIEDRRIIADGDFSALNGYVT